MPLKVTYKRKGILGDMSCQLHVSVLTIKPSRDYVTCVGNGCCEDCVLTSTGNVTPPEVLCGQWNKTACSDVSPKPIVREFKHAVCQTV